MNISELKLKPKIIEMTIIDEDIKQKYGDEIKFHIYDYLDIPTYFAFFKAQSENNTEELLNIMRKIILDEKGKPVMTQDYQLPIDIFTQAIVMISDHLGKSVTKNSSQMATGTQQ